MILIILATGLLLRSRLLPFHSHFSLDNSINIFEYNSMTRNHYRVFKSDYPYSITCTVVDWLDLIRLDVTKQIIIDSLRFLREEKSIKIFAFIIMHNHLHLILSSENLSGNICRFKSFTAKQIIKHYKSIGEIKVIQKLTAANPAYHQNCEHQFWQEGSCPKQIMSLDIFQQKIDYIHLNPVRKGYVGSPEEWKWSSARNYAGLDSMLQIDPIEDQSIRQQCRSGAQPRNESYETLWLRGCTP